MLGNRPVSETKTDSNSTIGSSAETRMHWNFHTNFKICLPTGLSTRYKECMTRVYLQDGQRGTKRKSITVKRSVVTTYIYDIEITVLKNLACWIKSSADDILE